MNRARDIAWWLAFTITGICIQTFIPGVDALAVGLVILLLERDYRNMLWLLPLFVLLQEGMGTSAFGASIAWYAITFAIFYVTRWFFTTENILFIFLLAGFLGAAYYGLAWLMAPLQNLQFSIEDTLNKSLFQAIYIPFAWFLCNLTRQWTRNVEEA